MTLYVFQKHQLYRATLWFANVSVSGTLQEQCADPDHVKTLLFQLLTIVTTNGSFLLGIGISESLFNRERNILFH